MKKGLKISFKNANNNCELQTIEVPLDLCSNNECDGQPPLTACDPFFLTANGELYAYKINLNTTIKLLVNDPLILKPNEVLVDVAHTSTKMWYMYKNTVTNVFYLREWDLFLTPFIATFNKTITLPTNSYHGALAAINNNQLITVINTNTVSVININNGSATITISGNMHPPFGEFKDIAYSFLMNSFLYVQTSPTGSLFSGTPFASLTNLVASWLHLQNPTPLIYTSVCSINGYGYITDNVGNLYKYDHGNSQSFTLILNTNLNIIGSSNTPQCY